MTDTASPSSHGALIGARRRRRAGVRVAVAVCAALALSACESAEERLAGHYERGAELLAAGEPDRAILEFRNALELDENHGPSRFGIAQVFEARGELRAALGNYRAAAELDPANAQARIKTAQLLMLGGQVDEARAFIDQAYALTPDDPVLLATRAGMAMRDGDAAAAAASARAAIEIDPGQIEANIILITMRYRDGDVDGALAEIDRLLPTAPDNLTLNLLKLRILEAEGRDEAFGAHLASLIDVYPDQISFRGSYVQWLVNSGRLEEAEQEMRAIVALDPADTERRLELTRFLLATQGAEVAEAELRAAIDAAETPALKSALINALSELYLSQDRRDEVIALQQQVIDAAPDSAEAHGARVALARLAFADGDMTRTRELVDATLAADPANAGALAMRARIQLASDEIDAAIDTVRRALDVEPDALELMLLEADVHIRAGNMEIAGDRLAAATRKSDYEPRIALNYAGFLRLRDQPEAAQLIIDDALRRNPEDRNLLLGLAELQVEAEDWAGAEVTAERLSALDEDASVAAGQLRAAALNRQGRAEESRAVLRNLADNPTAERAAVAGLVASYLAGGDIEEAEALVNRRLADNPQDADTLILKAEIALRRNDAEGAEQAVRDVIAAAPDRPIGYLALGRIEMARGDFEAAETVLDTGLEAVEEDSALRLLLAGLYERRGDYDAAIEAYETLYAGQRRNVVYANNLASLLAEHRANDPETLERAAQIAQRLRGSDVPEFQDTYGWTRFLIGDLDAATRALSTAAQALPNNALVQYHAGRAFAAINRPDEARRWLEAAIAVDPSFSKIDSARAALAALDAAAQSPAEPVQQ